MSSLPTPAVIMLLGASGAGKSTFAHARWAPEQILSLDHYRAVVSDDLCDQDATSDAAELLDLALRKRCARGLTTVVDTTGTHPESRRRIIAIARQHQIPAIAVVLDTPLTACLARQTIRQGPLPGARWGRAVPPEVVTAQHRHVRLCLPGLRREGFTAVHRIGAAEEPR